MTRASTESSVRFSQLKVNTRIDFVLTTQSLMRDSVRNIDEDQNVWQFSSRIHRLTGCN